MSTVAQLEYDRLTLIAESNELDARASRLQAALYLHPEYFVSSRERRESFAMFYAQQAEADDQRALSYRAMAAAIREREPVV